MKFTVTSNQLHALRTDALVAGLRTGEKLTGSLRTIDRLLGGVVSVAMEDEEFTGKAGQSLLVHTHGKIPARHVVLVGIGDGRGAAAEALRAASAVAVRRAKDHGAASLAFVLTTGFQQPEAAGQAIAEGALLGGYAFTKFKSKPQTKKPLTELSVVAPARVRARLLRGLVRGEMFATATMDARDLVNEPASTMTPTHLVSIARRLVEKHRGLSLKVFDAKALKTLGAGALLGVAKGSDEPPYLIHLRYRPRRAKRRIVLVGKGITFDSGGINLKPGKAMDNMKIDMSGAATILAVFSVLPILKPGVEVHGVIPTCENMPSGKAIKPGDIVQVMNGTTIEVLNTDAEGRLILADGLAYGQTLKPDVMIDIATLTGSCVVALGEEVAGLMSTSRSLTKSLLTAAESVGEKLWELPLVESYRPLLESAVADLANIGASRYGGAIEGGLFLKEFVGSGPWAHFDIAGPAWAEREFGPYLQKGATGYSVRTLLTYLLGR